MQLKLRLCASCGVHIEILRPNISSLVLKGVNWEASYQVVKEESHTDFCSGLMCYFLGARMLSWAIRIMYAAFLLEDGTVTYLSPCIEAWKLKTVRKQP